MVFRNFYIRCSKCGHRNRPNPSPGESIRLTILGHVGCCKGCGKLLKPVLDGRPLVRAIRAELEAKGIKPACRFTF